MAHVDLPKQNKACGLVLHCESNAFMKGGEATDCRSVSFTK